MGQLRVSVITTVYNESQQIERLLDSLAAQSRRPDEIILCDGGSTDGTVAIIQAWAARNQERVPTLQLLVEPGANISRGRNLAIAAAAGHYIAVTDAGVVLEPTWLAELVAPWIVLEKSIPNGDGLEKSEPLAVAGFFLADIVSQKSFVPHPSEKDGTKFFWTSISVLYDLRKRLGFCRLSGCSGIWLISYNIVSPKNFFGTSIR